MIPAEISHLVSRFPLFLIDSGDYGRTPAIGYARRALNGRCDNVNGVLEGDGFRRVRRRRARLPLFRSLLSLVIALILSLLFRVTVWHGDRLSKNLVLSKKCPLTIQF